MFSSKKLPAQETYKHYIPIVKCQNLVKIWQYENINFYKL